VVIHHHNKLPGALPQSDSPSHYYSIPSANKTLRHHHGFRLLLLLLLHVDHFRQPLSGAETLHHTHHSSFLHHHYHDYLSCCSALPLHYAYTEYCPPAVAGDDAAEEIGCENRSHPLPLHPCPSCSSLPQSLP